MAVTINTLREFKQKGEAFAALTSYDATFAQVVSEAGVDVILIGDSLGMVLQGHDSTLPVTMDQMVYHVSCVAKGNRGSLIMADMPFMSYGTVESALENAAELMRAGAHMVKLEGTDWMKETITALTERAVPVCAHLGLTPQFVNKFGGYKVQGRDEKHAELMIEHACELVAAGADAILLECVPAPLAARITQAVQSAGHRHRRRPGHRRPGTGVARHARHYQWPKAAIRQELPGRDRFNTGRSAGLRESRRRAHIPR